jgi:hypothetical protein
LRSSGIEHERAALLDQRLRERLGEGPLRQGVVDRLAAALLLGLVLGNQRELDPGAGPGMRGEVDGGFRVRLRLRLGRQRQRDARRGNQRAAADQALALLDHAFGRDQPVVVARPVGEAEGAARVVLRAGPRRRSAGPVRDRIDREAKAAGQAGANRKIAGAGQRKTLFAQIRTLVLGDRQRRETLSRRDGDIAASGDPDHQRRFHGRPQALLAGREIDHQGGHAGVERRVDPAVDPHGRDRGDGRAPVEGEAHPRAEFGTGHEGARRQGDKARSPKRVPIPRRHVRARSRETQARDGRLGAPAVQVPKRARAGIGLSERDRVLERPRRAVFQPGITIEPVERRPALRLPEAEKGPERRRKGRRKDRHAGHTLGGRRVEPDAKPGQGQKDDQNRERTPQRRPDALPPQGETRVLDEAFEALPHGPVRRALAATRGGVRAVRRAKTRNRAVAHAQASSRLTRAPCPRVPSD